TIEQLMRASEARGSRFYAGFALLYLGIVTLVQGRLEDALTASDWAAQRLAGNGDNDLDARVQLIRGKVFYERNDLEQALEQLRHGISLRYDPGALLFEGFPALAYTYLALGNSAAAHQAMERSLAEWTEAQAARKMLW